MTTMSLLDRAGLDRDEARRQLARGLEGADDGLTGPQRHHDRVFQAGVT